MQEATVSLLKDWESFYVIMGAAAGALTALTFVGTTLIAGMRQQRKDGDTIAAFSTPTVVHFGAALFITATLSAPWQVLWLPGLLLGVAGLGGIGYVIIVLRRTLRQNAYQPVLEDWVWHIILPFGAYIALVAATIVLPSNPVSTLFVVGAATLLLLFIGIHNSWDGVTYITTKNFQTENKSQNQTGD